MEAPRATVMLACALAGCGAAPAYAPGALVDGASDTAPGARVGCIDVAVSQTFDALGGSSFASPETPVVLVELGNRCGRPAPVRLGRVRATAWFEDGRTVALHFDDPRGEVRDVWLDGTSAGAERLALVPDAPLPAPPAQVCLDVSRISDAPGHDGPPLCFRFHPSEHVGHAAVYEGSHHTRRGGLDASELVGFSQLRTYGQGWSDDAPPRRTLGPAVVEVGVTGRSVPWSAVDAAQSANGGTLDVTLRAPFGGGGYVVGLVGLGFEVAQVLTVEPPGSFGGPPYEHLPVIPIVVGGGVGYAIPGDVQVRFELAAELGAAPSIRSDSQFWRYAEGGLFAVAGPRLGLDFWLNPHVTFDLGIGALVGTEFEATLTLGLAWHPLSHDAPS